jgi:hypothetical protein
MIRVQDQGSQQGSPFVIHERIYTVSRPNLQAMGHASLCPGHPSSFFRKHEIGKLFADLFLSEKSSANSAGRVTATRSVKPRSLRLSLTFAPFRV